MTTEGVGREVDSRHAVIAAVEEYLTICAKHGGLEELPDRMGWVGYLCVRCDRLNATAEELAWDGIQDLLWAGWNRRRNEAQLPTLPHSYGDAPDVNARGLRLVWSRD